MNEQEKSSQTTPGRLEKRITASLGVVLAGLVIWGIIENHLFQIAVILGGLCLLFLGVLFAAAWRKGLRWFLTRNALRFHFWVIVGLVSVIVLFYAEERWRGRRAWVALQKEAAARGESLDLSSVIPPEVPDAANFAKAPGVAEMLRFGKMKDEPDRREAGSTFYHGKPDNWPLADWSQQQFTDFEKWEKFLSQVLTTNATREGRSTGNATSSTNAAAAVLENLSRFDASFATLRAAANRPLSRYPIEYREGWAALDRNVYRIITDLRYGAHALGLRASALVAMGKADEALEDVLLALRLAETLKKEPFITAHHYRAQMLMGAVQPVWEGLAKHAWNEAQLEKIQERFASMSPASDALQAARGETILTMDMANQLEAYLEGKASRMGQNLSEQKGADAFMAWLFRTFYPSGWLAQDRVWVYRFYQKYGAENRAEITQLDQESWRAELFRATDPMLLVLVVPRMKEVCEDSIEWGLYLETVCQQAATACALERFRLGSSGRYPGSLEELVPSTLDRVPTDRLAGAGKPMIYRLAGAGNFTLYSVGLNKTDDRGKPMPVEHRWYPRFHEGDWVWRYL